MQVQLRFGSMRSAATTELAHAFLIVGRGGWTSSLSRHTGSLSRQCLSSSTSSSSGLCRSTGSRSRGGGGFSRCSSSAALEHRLVLLHLLWAKKLGEARDQVLATGLENCSRELLSCLSDVSVSVGEAALFGAADLTNELGKTNGKNRHVLCAALPIRYQGIRSNSSTRRDNTVRNNECSEDLKACLQRADA